MSDLQWQLIFFSFGLLGYLGHTFKKVNDKSDTTAPNTIGDYWKLKKREVLWGGAQYAILFWAWASGELASLLGKFGIEKFDGIEPDGISSFFLGYFSSSIMPFLLDRASSVLDRFKGKSTTNNKE
jgi:hypothetical protein